MVEKAIPEEWIKNYVDSLLKAAERFGSNSPMGTAALIRADHAMDLVKAFREVGGQQAPHEEEA